MLCTQNLVPAFRLSIRFNNTRTNVETAPSHLSVRPLIISQTNTLSRDFHEIFIEFVYNNCLTARFSCKFRSVNRYLLKT